MKDDVDLRDYILEKSRYVSFIHEIDLYCGPNGGDVVALERISLYYKEAFVGLDPQISNLTRPDNLVGLKLPQEDKLDEFTSEFAKTYGDKESRDGEHRNFEDAQESQIQFRQRLAHRPIDDSVITWVYAIRAYSVCIKNLEVIDAVKKQEHLDGALDRWARLTAFGVTIRRYLLSRQRT